MSDPIDVVEMKNMLDGLAEIIRHYFLELIEQGFTEQQALALTVSYQKAISGGQSSE